jgi:AAHS family 4-hydroxybenzoate transporter-like MFS transporter
MSRIAPGTDYALPAPVPGKRSGFAAFGALGALIGPRFRRYTWRLWLIYSGSSFLLYLLMSWLPVLLGGAGWSQPDALRGIAALQLGGIAGSLGLALLVDRGQAVRALLIAFSMTGTGALLFATLPSTGLVWSLVLVYTGAGLFGVTYAILAIAAKFYPPELRAAGFGWAAAVARSGAIVGPLAGGAMLASGLEPRVIVALLAGPALICILASLTLRQVMTDERRAAPPPNPLEARP